MLCHVQLRPGDRQRLDVPMEVQVSMRTLIQDREESIPGPNTYYRGWSPHKAIQAAGFPPAREETLHTVEGREQGDLGI